MLTNDERRSVVAPLERASTLPPHAYTDPSVFAHEVATIFRRDWICVARLEQITDPNTYIVVDVIDQPLVITRDERGQLRAMANVCLHRAMPLVDSGGSGRRLVCPYHRWSYGLDGRLVSAPLMSDVDGFDPAECRLPQVALETWEGFIFVSLADDPQPLGPQLEPMRVRLENYHLGDLVIACTREYNSPWNWKILNENFMEAYHHVGAHARSFQHSNPAQESYVVDNDAGSWALLVMPGHSDLDESINLPFLPGLQRAQRSDLIAACVFPVGLLSASGTLVAWYEVVPHAHDRMTLRIHVLVEPDVASSTSLEAALPDVVAGVDWIHSEDIPVNVGPWRGLHAPLTAQGRLSSYEGAIWQLNQMWINRIESHRPPSPRRPSPPGG